MKITFDPAKRATTLETRGLDMADAAQVFENPHLTYVDDRMDYGEKRYITLGHLAGRMGLLRGQGAAIQPASSA